MGRFNTGANGCSRVWSPHKHDDQLIKEGKRGSSSGLSFCIEFFFTPVGGGLIHKYLLVFDSIVMSDIRFSSLSFIGCVVAGV